jgi:Protein of unknown function (DUF4231)
MSRLKSEADPDSGYARLDSQIRWYDEKSASAQRWYKLTKLIEMAFAATVPLAATLHGVAAGLLGVAIVVLEGLQQLNQWQHNWITYRSTCEALRHEKYSYLGGSGVYDGLAASTARKVLVERIEGLVSTEHSKWQSRQEYEASKGAKSTEQVHDE